MAILGMLLVIALSVSGCASFIGAVIPAHSKSKKESPSVVCVTIGNVPVPTAAPAIVAALAPVIVGVFVDQVIKGLEQESKAYTASYSGRSSSHLYRRSAGSDPSQHARDLTIIRYFGQDATDCAPPEPKQDKVKLSEFAARIQLIQGDGDYRMIQLVPTRFQLEGTKAKVSAFRSQVDINAQVTLASFVARKSGSATPEAIERVELIKADFPIGRVDLDRPVSMTEAQLAHLKTDLVPLPMVTLGGAPPGGGQGAAAQRLSLFLPVNATMTIMEADDFGDVIGDTAKKLSENRQKVLEGILKTLGLGGDEKKTK